MYRFCGKHNIANPCPVCADRAALAEAPDVTCDSPEARAWREKHAAAIERAKRDSRS